MCLLLQPCHPKLFRQKQPLPGSASDATRLTGLARIGALQQFTVGIRQRPKFFDGDPSTRSGPIQLLLVGELTKIRAMGLVRIIHKTIGVSDVASFVDLNDALEKHRKDETVAHLQKRTVQDIVVGEVIARQMAVVAVNDFPLPIFIKQLLCFLDSISRTKGFEQFIFSLARNCLFDNKRLKTVEPRRIGIRIQLSLKNIEIVKSTSTCCSLSKFWTLEIVTLKNSTQCPFDPYAASKNVE